MYVSQLIAVVVGIREYLHKASGRTKEAKVQDTTGLLSKERNPLQNNNNNNNTDTRNRGQRQTKSKGHVGGGGAGGGGGVQGMSTNVVDFTFGANIDHINLFRLATYIRVSRIAVKVQGLADAHWQQQQQQQQQQQPQVMIESACMRFEYV
jgi:hypothetical protein